jgi:hypothetical protein
MSIQSNGTSIGRPRRLQSIQDRAARLQALQFCSSRVGKILQQYSDWFEDESLPIKERSLELRLRADTRAFLRANEN